MTLGEKLTEPRPSPRGDVGTSPIVRGRRRYQTPRPRETSVPRSPGGVGPSIFAQGGRRYLAHRSGGTSVPGPSLAGDVGTAVARRGRPLDLRPGETSVPRPSFGGDVGTRPLARGRRRYRGRQEGSAPRPSPRGDVGTSPIVRGRRRYQAPRSRETSVPRSPGGPLLEGSRGSNLSGRLRGHHTPSCFGPSQRESTGTTRGSGLVRIHRHSRGHLRPALWPSYTVIFWPLPARAHRHNQGSWPRPRGPRTCPSMTSGLVSRSPRPRPRVPRTCPSMASGLVSRSPRPRPRVPRACPLMGPRLGKPESPTASPCAPEGLAPVGPGRSRRWPPAW